MKPTVTDKQMRDAWKRRTEARKTMGRNHKLICDYDDDEREELERCERIIAETSGTLMTGLRERGGMFWLNDDFPLVLDGHGDMVPVWPWLNDNAFYRKYRKALMTIVEMRSQRKAVAV